MAVLTRPKTRDGLSQSVTDQWTDQQMDGPTNGWTDRQTDKAGCSTRLKSFKNAPGVSVATLMHLQLVIHEGLSF